MESKHGCDTNRFFLPIGDLESLQAEVGFLRELQGETYESAMSIPFSRRKQFVEQKQEIESNRRSNQRQEANRMRAQARRRR